MQNRCTSKFADNILNRSSYIISYLWLDTLPTWQLSELPRCTKYKFQPNKVEICHFYISIYQTHSWIIWKIIINFIPKRNDSIIPHEYRKISEDERKKQRHPITTVCQASRLSLSLWQRSQIIYNIMLVSNDIVDERKGTLKCQQHAKKQKEKNRFL